MNDRSVIKMTAFGYLIYVTLILGIAVIGYIGGISIDLIYLAIAALIFAAAIIRWFLACKDGTIYHDQKKVEQIDNSVTKPASFKHCFIYNDCSSKTLFFLELPYVIVILVMLILRFLGIGMF